MAAFSSWLGLRRILRAPSSSSPQLQWRWPLSSGIRGFSSAPEGGDGGGTPASISDIFGSDANSNKNLPPLTTPKLFVSGLSRLTTEENLKVAFAKHGQLVDAKLITDRVSGRSKGFGFVTYATIEEAEKAREGMNATFLDGWVIFVDPAKPREPRPPRQSEPEPSETGFRTNKTIGWCG